MQKKKLTPVEEFHRLHAAFLVEYANPKRNNRHLIYLHKKCIHILSKVPVAERKQFA